MRENSSASYREWKCWQEADFGQCTADEAAYFSAEFRDLGIIPDPNACVLEVGFGNGQFAGWAKDKFGQYVGTELDKELVIRARDRGYEAHLATLDLTEVAGLRRFNCILAFDVFEHLTVEELVGLLRTAAKCMVDDGVILARFPSGDSPFGRSIQYGDITHKTVIGSGRIQQIADAAGLVILRIKAPSFPLLGLGIRKFVRRGAVALSQKVMAKMINLTFNGNQPKVISSNMVVLLGRTPRIR